MKQKILLLGLLIAGFAYYANAQETETQTRLESRERARVAARASVGRSAAVSPDETVVTGYYVSRDKEQKRMSLKLSKHFEGESISSDADFEVSEGQQAISLNLSGTCREGTIVLTIIQPNGDTMKSQKITNAADISWSAMIPIDEDKKKNYVGKWKLEVKTDKAEGHYNLNISSR